MHYLTQCIVGLFNTPLRFLPTANPTRSRNRVQNVQRGKKVNKTELIEEIAKSADLTKASAARALDAMIDAVTNTLKNNDSVTLVGFGTFTVGDRAARTGRDPRTKEAIKIKAAKVPKFKAGKALKDAVN
ncbi:MAG: HU family DNA-binding protein [Massilia sp.]